MIIAYITDLHLDEANAAELGANTRRNWERIYDDLQQHEVDMIVLGGDIGEGEAMPWFFNHLRPYAWHVTPGNHDIRGQIRNWYRNRNMESQNAIYFSVDMEGHRLIFLDSAPDMVETEQLQWLRTQVQTELPLVVFIHHPVLPVDTWVDKQFPLKNRGAVKNVLKSQGGDVTIFCGHYHLEYTQQDGSITQHICPSAAFNILEDPDQFKAEAKAACYQLITIEEGEVSRKVIRLTV